MQTRNLLAALAAAVALAGTGCENDTPGLDHEPGAVPGQPPLARDTPEATEPTTPAVPEPRQGCPTEVEGLGVLVAPTDDGVAISFTTSTGDVGDLRERVRHLATMYQRYHRKGGPDIVWRYVGRGPGVAGQRDADRGWGPMPEVEVSVENIPQGARVEIRPEDPSDLQAVRDVIRHHHERMQGGECFTLQGTVEPAPDQARE